MRYDEKSAGRTIRELRQAKGLTQESLSGLAGIARTHLTMIENGSKQANFETICKIAFALELKPSELVKKIEDSFIEG